LGRVHQFGDCGWWEKERIASRLEHESASKWGKNDDTFDDTFDDTSASSYMPDTFINVFTMGHAGSQINESERQK